MSELFLLSKEQFYRGQVLLETNNSGEEYYTMLAGSPKERTDPRTIRVYVPIPPDKKPAKTHTVLKYSEKVIASFKAQAIKE